MHTLKLDNGIEIDLLTEGGLFKGIGGVRAGATVLRSARRPMFVELRNPDGVELIDFKPASHRNLEGGGVELEFTMRRRAGGIMEWMVHEVRQRYNVSDWTEEAVDAPDTKLRLTILPIRRKVGATDCAGFSYQYHYQSGSITNYKLLDRGTWEIGGKASGNEFWMRNCFVPAIVSFKSPQEFYSSEWYIPDALNPNVFQFLPLQTELQGFTFTTHASGTLMTWATQVAHVRSLFEKPRGKDDIVHLHEHCGDLALEFSTSPVEVLWAPGGLDKVGKANLYEAMKEIVHESLHQQIGMDRERTGTYGQIEEWTLPDMPRYTDIGLPKLLDIGMKTIDVANHFQNNMNTYGVSNMCCTVDYKVAETVGADKLKRFCDKAKAAGARVEMWGNTSISTLTIQFANKNSKKQRVDFLPEEGSIMQAFAKAKWPFARNASNAIEADHYTPQFAVLNLRDPSVREYWMKSWKFAADEVGLGGIFLDSSFNLSSDKFHWVQNPQAGMQGATADQTHLLGHYRPEREPQGAILSQYRAHLDLMAEMQKAGYQYCNEDLGVFGLHRHGPGVEKRLDSLSIWTECLVGFDAPAIESVGGNADETYFRGMAYRMMWTIVWDVNKDKLSFHYGGVRGPYDEPNAWHLSLLKAFNRVADNLHNRRILPGEQGVIYEKNGKRILWAFTDFTLPLETSTTVVDVLTDKRSTTSSLNAKKHSIYEIG